jgi:hypothetical protein
MVRVMKAEIAVLIMIILTIVFPVLSSPSQNEDGQDGLAGYESSRLSIMSLDTKRLEERMAGALVDMMSKSQSDGEGKGSNGDSISSGLKGSNPLNPELPGTNHSVAGTSVLNSSIANISALNFSTTNASINSSATNGSATDAFAGNQSGLNSSIPAPGGSTGNQGIGSSSNAKFDGYYGIKSSQHQMGKNNIDSSTFLSGSFSMEKAVKFQDIGI